MFRVISSTILLIAFAIQSFYMGGIVVDYYMNTSSYSKNCENKAKPILKCNGKCQMAKKILAEQKKDEKNPERKFVNKNEVVFQSGHAGISLEVDILVRTYKLPSPAQEPLSPIHAIFHPPCLV